MMQRFSAVCLLSFGAHATLEVSDSLALLQHGVGQTAADGDFQVPPEVGKRIAKSAAMYALDKTFRGDDVRKTFDMLDKKLRGDLAMSQNLTKELANEWAVELRKFAEKAGPQTLELLNKTARAVAGKIKVLSDGVDFVKKQVSEKVTPGKVALLQDMVGQTADGDVQLPPEVRNRIAKSVTMYTLDKTLRGDDVRKTFDMLDKKFRGDLAMSQNLTKELANEWAVEFRKFAEKVGPQTFELLNKTARVVAGKFKALSDGVDFVKKQNPEKVTPGKVALLQDMVSDEDLQEVPPDVRNMIDILDKKLRGDIAMSQNISMELANAWTGELHRFSKKAGQKQLELLNKTAHAIAGTFMDFVKKQHSKKHG